MACFTKDIELKIKELEREITNVKKKNQKTMQIRRLKISLLLFKRIFPYLAIAGISIVPFKFTSAGYPFYPNDKQKKYANTLEKFDSFGNYHKETEYLEKTIGKENKTNSQITFYSKWHLNKDNLYEREVNVYEVDLAYDNILALLENPDMLNDILTNPIINKKEVANNIYQNEEYFEVSLESILKDDYILVKESTAGNLLVTIIYLYAFCSLSIMYASYRNTHHPFDYQEEISKINHDNPFSDVESLERTLKITKDNYEWLNEK